MEGVQIIPPEKFQYPPVAFHFSVKFFDLGDKSNDIRFQSVSGLEVDVQTESLKEGGENRFEHIMPVRSKYATLKLKRGIFHPKDSDITKWCKDAFENMEINPKNLLISLLNEEHEPLMSWKVIHAWPKKWSVNELNAEQNSALIENFELEYNYFQLQE